MHRTMRHEAASRKARLAVHALAVASCLALSGCVVPGVVQQGGVRPEGAPGDGDVRDSGRGVFPVSSKPVYGKESPATLVAVDGSRCTVTSKKFEKTREGDRVLCAWRKG